MRRVIWVLLLPPLAAAGRSQAQWGYFASRDEAGRPFEEVAIGDTMVVYFHQRTVGDAIVEKDYIVHQYGMRSGRFLETKSHWREGVPERLPEGYRWGGRESARSRRR